MEPPPPRRPPGISVFFPAYNDAGSIGSLVREAVAVLRTLTDDYEVIVINDGSTDATPRVLGDLALEFPQVRIIHHGVNRGYGAALRTGFGAAAKELIFYTDGDGQYDVRELAELYPLMAGPVDVVNGYKIKRADGRYRILIGSVYNLAARFLFRLPVRDVDCDFRLMRRGAVRRVNLISSSGVICVELVRKMHAAGCVFAESPVHHYPRLHGRSQFFTLGRVARTACDFLLLWLKIVAAPWAFAGGREGQASPESGSPRTKEPDETS